jgi:hypothetical protein
VKAVVSAVAVRLVLDLTCRAKKKPAAAQA